MEVDGIITGVRLKVVRGLELLADCRQVETRLVSVSSSSDSGRIVLMTYRDDTHGAHSSTLGQGADPQLRIGGEGQRLGVLLSTSLHGIGAVSRVDDLVYRIDSPKGDRDALTGKGHTVDAPIVGLLRLGDKVIVVVESETGGEVLETTDKVVKVLLLDRSPSHLSNRSHTGLSHILGVMTIGDILRPVIALHAEDMGCHLSSDMLGDGHVGVHLRQCRAAAEGNRLHIGITLVVIKVKAVRGGGHDHIVTGLGGIDATLLATPRHDRGILRDSTLEDLIPADHPLAVLAEEGPDLGDKPALQLILILKSLLTDPLLAIGAALPLRLGSFIATDVDEVGMEEGHHLRQYVLVKLDRGVLTGTNHLIGDAPDITHLIREVLPLASKPGVC